MASNAKNLIIYRDEATGEMTLYASPVLFETLCASTVTFVEDIEDESAEVCQVARYAEAPAKVKAQHRHIL